VLTPPNFSNDNVSGIENGSKGCVVETTATIYGKIQRFFGPTHPNRWLTLKEKRTEKRQNRFYEGHFVKEI